MGIADEEIKQLAYCLLGPGEDKGKMTKLKLGHRKSVQLLSWFLMFIQDEHENSITCADILNVTKDSYMDFVLLRLINTFNLLNGRKRR